MSLSLSENEPLSNITFTTACQGSECLEAGHSFTVTPLRTYIGRKRKVGLVDYTHMRCTTYGPPTKLREGNVFGRVCLSAGGGIREYIA